MLINQNANFNGGAYAGFLGYEEFIAPDSNEFEGMFDAIDFLKPKHVKYYHVGLPTVIFKGNDINRKRLLGDILNKLGIGFSNVAVEVFIILHEFGHAHEFLVADNGDVIKYAKRMNYKDSELYRLKYRNLDNYSKELAYRNIPSEIYADNYSKRYIREVLELLKTKNTLHSI